MKSINPATGELIRDHPEHTPDEVQERIAAAATAFASWKELSIADRGEYLRAAAAVLRKNTPTYARLMAEEMGKPITQGEAEIEKCAACCEYYAEYAEGFLAAAERTSDASKSYVRYDPLGPVLAVMPWNFPFWQLFRFAAPGLMAGNVGLLKHASNVSGCALAIEDVFHQAEFPSGVLTTLLVGSDGIADIIRNPAIAAVTLTGSEAAGRAVAEIAGRELKKCVLELGGSDPFIVLADADVEETAWAAAKARTINSGQSCIAAKRFLVAEAIADEFEQAMADAMAGMVVGDPLDRETEIGPQAREDLLDELQSQVTRSVEVGARIICGGQKLKRAGSFYPPTMLTDVKPGMPAFDDELFGPVAAVTKTKDAADAVRLANLSRYGLGASIWTQDAAAAEQIAAQIESGCVFINGIVKSDPRLPFGGVKASGFGRELSVEGIREFVNTKTVWVGTA